MVELGTMKASIVITSYKRNSFLKRAIDSCLNQDFEDSFEIIVVDDNGNNKKDYQQQNLQLLSAYINDRKIEYIVNETNIGACQSRNKGAFWAKGKYLFFLDDDDEFLPSKVSTQVSFLDENSKFDAHTSAFLRKRNNEYCPTKDGLPLVGDLKNFLMHGNFYTPMLCVKKEAFVAMEGFRDIPKFQDLYFMCHFLANNRQVYEDTEALFIQHEHQNDRISNASVKNAEIATRTISEFAYSKKNLFNEHEWQKVELRLCLLLATSYYSSNYMNRLKSIKYWWKCFRITKNTSHLTPIVKCFISNNLMKEMEKIKAKNKNASL